MARKRRRVTTSLSAPIRTQMQKISGVLPSLPMTPPDPGGLLDSPGHCLAPSTCTAIHVISTERAALAHLERIYLMDKLAQDSIERAVTTVANTVRSGGKLIISGVGKSGKIAEKVVATMNSLGVQSTFLHPTEALHGDLGMIRPGDAVLLVTFSGKTPELLRLKPYLPATVPLIAITAHESPDLCPLLADSNSPDPILLTAPVHEHEDISFGLPAPMTSTTVALALGDALALATSRKLYNSPDKGPAEVFKGFHPGGAIGAASAVSTTPVSESASSSISASSIFSEPLLPKREPQVTPAPSPNRDRCISDIGTPFSVIHPISPQSTQHLGKHSIIDVLRGAVRSPAARSWVLLSPTAIIPPEQVCRLSEERNVEMSLQDLPYAADVIVHKKDWFHVSKDSTTKEVKGLIIKFNEACGHVIGRLTAKSTMSSVIAITDGVTGDIISVVEGKDLLDD
ncbi:sugar isomerase [Histoplasma capsulatum G186AR]|uniref:Sugar isomerase n=2 Tax=Ajellomyces capsulatus TaxID=5037 RepID=C0NRV6_AJECG|nr:sugar isomerase [Histoplasma capsulatum G186AR]EEH05622.1 sugar isomerase [Histoplasma capsulatum G186AR]